MDSYLVSSTLFTLKISILLVILVFYIILRVIMEVNVELLFINGSLSLCVNSPFLLLLMMSFKSFLIRDISFILRSAIFCRLSSCMKDA